MGKESNTKVATAAKVEEKTSAAAAAEDDTDDIPEDVLAYKEELERKTGKKYKYRSPKKDMPGIGHMLAHGAPEDENRPRTWIELIGYPLALVVLFVISFHIFWWIDPIENSRYKKGRFSLPGKKPILARKGAAGSGDTVTTPVKSDDPPPVTSQDL